MPESAALREPPKSNCGSIASNSQCRSDSGTPSRMQIICMGSSAATSTRKSNGWPGTDIVQQTPGPRPQVVLDARIIRGVRPELTSRRIAECRGSSIMLSTWPAIDRSCSSVPPNGPRAAGDRRVGHRITQHRKGFGVGGHRPEALAVGGVVGRLVPVDGRLGAMHGEQLVRKARREVVQIGEVDPR